jgi:Sec1 family
MALSNDELSFEVFPSLLPMPASSSAQAGRSSTLGGGARNNPVASARKSTSGAASSARKAGGPSAKWSANSSSLSASSAGSANSRSGGPIAFSGARHLVFMVGGLCYAEMRVAREVMEVSSREIVLGSTSFISANEFLDDLGKLSR